MTASVRLWPLELAEASNVLGGPRVLLSAVGQREVLGRLRPGPGYPRGRPVTIGAGPCRGASLLAADANETPARPLSLPESTRDNAFWPTSCTKNFAKEVTYVSTRDRMQFDRFVQRFFIGLVRAKSARSSSKASTGGHPACVGAQVPGLHVPDFVGNVASAVGCIALAVVHLLNYVLP